jgi:hypothetical protein
MSDQILSEEKKVPAETSTAIRKTETEPAACPVQAKGWLKGAFGMAICCAAPLLLVAGIAFFGLSLGALASGALSLAALLACPVGMFLMMRMMMKDKK